jgi:hypothetical protein
MHAPGASPPEVAAIPPPTSTSASTSALLSAMLPVPLTSAVSPRPRPRRPPSATARKPLPLAEAPQPVSEPGTSFAVAAGDKGMWHADAVHASAAPPSAVNAAPWLPPSSWAALNSVQAAGAAGPAAVTAFGGVAAAAGPASVVLSIQDEVHAQNDAAPLVAASSSNGSAVALPLDTAAQVVSDSPATPQDGTVSVAATASPTGPVSVQVARLRAQVWELQTQLAHAKDKEWRQSKALRGDLAEARADLVDTERLLQDTAGQLARWGCQRFAARA